MKILSAEEMAAADRRTVEGGLPLHALMEAAGAAVAAFVLRQYPDAARVMVLCGKGNNGGDGCTAARLLAGEGVGVRVLLAGRIEDLRNDAAEAMRLLRETTEPDVVEEIGDEISAGELVELFEEADLFVSMRSLVRDLEDQCAREQRLPSGRRWRS